MATTATSDSEGDKPQGDRRSFIKGAMGASAALLGTAAVLVSEATAQAQLAAPQLKAVEGFLPRASKAQVNLTFDPDAGGLGGVGVHIKELQLQLLRVFDKFGCPACGLVGFDLRVAINPVSEVTLPGLKGSLTVDGQF